MSSVIAIVSVAVATASTAGAFVSPVDANFSALDMVWDQVQRGSINCRRTVRKVSLATFKAFQRRGVISTVPVITGSFTTRFEGET